MFGFEDGPCYPEGMVRWLENSSQETMTRDSILYASDFEMAQNSNHSFFQKFLLEILVTCFFTEKAHFFSSKMLRWHKIRKKMNSGKNDKDFEPSQKQMHIIFWHVLLSLSIIF